MIRRKIACAVRGCESDYKGQRFPHPGRDFDRFKEWISIIKREDLLSTKDPIKIYTNHRLCKRHFSEKCYLYPGRIRSDAVPELYLPDASVAPSLPGPPPSSEAVKCTEEDIKIPAGSTSSLPKSPNIVVPNTEGNSTHSSGKKENEVLVQSSKNDYILPESSCKFKKEVQNQAPTYNNSGKKENEVLVQSSKNDYILPENSCKFKKEVQNRAPTYNNLGNKENRAVVNFSKQNYNLSESKLDENVTNQVSATSATHDFEMDYDIAQNLCQPLLQEGTTAPKKKLEKYCVKVLGQQNLDQHEVITSILSKVKHPQKRGSVYVIPVKKPGNITDLTRNSLKKIIENSPTVGDSLKNRLLKILKSKNLSFNQHDQDKSTLKRKHARSRKAGQCIRDKSSLKRKRLRSRKTGQCTCPVHCITRGYKKQKVCNVTPGLHIKINGSCPGDSQLDNIFEEAENVFTVSSMITNVNNKDQLERVCQLVLESIFKLKNVNVNGTKSKIEIILCQNSEEVSEVERLSNETVQVPSCTSEILRSTENNTEQSAGISSQINETSSKDFPANDCQFSELQNGEKSSTVSDSTLNNSQTKEYSECFSSETNKNSNYCQNPKVKNLKVDLNFYHDHSYLSLDSQVIFQKPPYLVNLVNIDKYKSSKKKSRVIKCMPSEGSSKTVQKELAKLRKQISRLRELVKSKNKNIENINVKLKYLRNKFCIEQGLKRIRYPKTECKDSVQVVDNEEENLDFSKKDQEINIIKEKKKKRKEKKNIILTPDFEVLPLEGHNLETSVVEYGDKYEFFYESFLEECIEKG